MAPKTTTRTVANGEVAIRYTIYGTGKPIVLLHGFTDQSQTWMELGYVAALVAAGYRPILIDQRGHGGSGRPHGAEAYGDRERAGDVAAVLDDLAIARADILGYSMGGWVTLNVARYHPDRIDRMLVGGAHPFGQSMAVYRDAVAGDIEKWITTVDQLGGPMSDAWKRRVRTNDMTALRAAVAADRPDISEDLAEFDRPGLFFAGTEDPLHDSVARCGAFFRRGRFVPVPGCNHVTAFLRRDLVMPEILAFLSAPAGQNEGG